jgi:hypothetical protein
MSIVEEVVSCVAIDSFRGRRAADALTVYIFIFNLFFDLGLILTVSAWTLLHSRPFDRNSLIYSSRRSLLNVRIDLLLPSPLLCQLVHSTITMTTGNAEYSKKEEFRRYLEKTGVMDALTKVLVGLYEEPDRSQINALEYVKKYLGAPAGVDLDGLKRENEELKKQLEKYKKLLDQKDKK